MHAMRYEARGIVSVELRDVDGKTLPEYVPGVHIELHPSNRLMCSCSLRGVPKMRDRYVVGVLLSRSNHDGSRYVHEQLRVGSALEIGGLRSHFEMDGTVSYTVLVAGGTGVTPIICVARRLAEQGKALSMLYCTRSRADAAFTSELAGYSGAMHLRLDAEAGGLPDLKVLLVGHSTGAHFYCCGPGLMLCVFEAACKALDYTNAHIERFAAGPGVKLAQNGEYQVKLARSGVELYVPAGKSLLNALLEIGVGMERSYKGDVCGSCETCVLEGEPDHRNGAFSRSGHASDQTMTVYVSGCEGKCLMIDL